MRKYCYNHCRQANDLERYRWVGQHTQFCSIGVPASVLMATQFAITDAVGEIDGLYDTSKGIIIRVRDLLARGLSIDDIVRIEPEIPADVVGTVASGTLPVFHESPADFVF